jgi:2-methylcitrate dehydratase
VTVRLTTGASYTHEVKDYPGFATRPFTWDEIVAKLDDLATDHADEGLCKEIAGAVRSLESIRVKDLMKLLARVDGAGSSASARRAAPQSAPTPGKET